MRHMQKHDGTMAALSSPHVIYALILFYLLHWIYFYIRNGHHIIHLSLSFFPRGFNALMSVGWVGSNAIELLWPSNKQIHGNTSSVTHSGWAFTSSSLIYPSHSSAVYVLYKSKCAHSHTFWFQCCLHNVQQRRAFNKPTEMKTHFLAWTVRKCI